MDYYKRICRLRLALNTCFCINLRIPLLIKPIFFFYNLSMKVNAGAGVRHKFDPQQVIAITADINYSYVHLVNGSCLLRSRTLKWFSERWPTLLRIHKNALINVEHIHHYSLITGKRPSGYVVMTNSLRLEVSRRNIKDARERLNLVNQNKPLRQPA